MTTRAVPVAPARTTAAGCLRTVVVGAHGAAAARPAGSGAAGGERRSRGHGRHRLFFRHPVLRLRRSVLRLEPGGWQLGGVARRGREQVVDRPLGFDQPGPHRAGAEGADRRRRCLQRFPQRFRGHAQRHRRRCLLHQRHHPGDVRRRLRGAAEAPDPADVFFGEEGGRAAVGGGHVGLRDHFRRRQRRRRRRSERRSRSSGSPARARRSAPARRRCRNGWRRPRSRRRPRRGRRRSGRRRRPPLDCGYSVAVTPPPFWSSANLVRGACTPAKRLIASCTVDRGLAARWSTAGSRPASGSRSCSVSAPRRAASRRSGSAGRRPRRWRRRSTVRSTAGRR